MCVFVNVDFPFFQFSTFTRNNALYQYCLSLISQIFDLFKRLWPSFFFSLGLLRFCSYLFECIVYSLPTRCKNDCWRPTNTHTLTFVYMKNVSFLLNSSFGWLNQKNKSTRDKDQRGFISKLRFILLNQKKNLESCAFSSRF